MLSLTTVVSYVAVILLAWPLVWPWHHKPKPANPRPALTAPVEVSPETLYIIQHCVPYAEDDSDFAFAYFGPDGAIGYGKDCYSAMSDWKVTKPPRNYPTA